MIQAIDKFIYLQSAVFIMVHYYELLSRHMFEALRNSGGNRLIFQLYLRIQGNRLPNVPSCSQQFPSFASRGANTSNRIFNNS